MENYKEGDYVTSTVYGYYFGLPAKIHSINRNPYTGRYRYHIKLIGRDIDIWLDGDQIKRIEPSA